MLTIILPLRPKPRPVRSREQLLVELKYRIERVDFLTNDVERCISLPTESLQICKSRLEEAVRTKNANAQELRALRRAVKEGHVKRGESPQPPVARGEGGSG